jgi:hypothetical protein
MQQYWSQLFSQGSLYWCLRPWTRQLYRLKIFLVESGPGELLFDRKTAPTSSRCTTKTNITKRKQSSCLFMLKVRRMSEQSDWQKRMENEWLKGCTLYLYDFYSVRTKTDEWSNVSVRDIVHDGYNHYPLSLGSLDGRNSQTDDIYPHPFIAQKKREEK